MADRSWLKKGVVCWGVYDCAVNRVTTTRWDDTLLAWRCTGGIYRESTLFETELDALEFANKVCSEEIENLQDELYQMIESRTRIQDRIDELLGEKSDG